MATQTFWRDRALPFVESRRACRSHACYVPHAHDTVSIGAVDHGTSLFSSGGTTTRVIPGSLVMVPAGHVHACNPEPGASWSYQMLHLDRDWVHGVLAESDDDAAAPLAHPAVGHARAAYERFCTLNDLLFTAADPAEKEAALIEFVGGRNWLPAQRPAAQPPRLAPLKLRRIVALLEDDCGERLPVAQLAALADMSRYAFIRAFRARTGMTPHAYQLDLRIRRARALLRAGRALTDVAHELGFADQSHFQRVFKQRVAVTPGGYSRCSAHGDL